MVARGLVIHLTCEKRDKTSRYRLYSNHTDVTGRGTGVISGRLKYL